MGIKIQRLTTSGGYLEAAHIEFCGALTCIIGARGTCKSTIIETIRFVFDCDRDRIQRMTSIAPPTAEQAESHEGLLVATLGAATARCEIVDGETDQQNFSLERDIGSQPRVYRDDVKQLTDQQVLQCVEIYSQGELQKIAEEPLRRLELIDKPNQRRISNLRHARDQRMKRLREVGNAIRAKRSGVESRRADLKALDIFQHDLAALQKNRPELSPELDAERNAFNERQTVVNDAAELLSQWNSLIETLIPIASSAEDYQVAANRLKSLPYPEAEILSKRFLSIAEFAGRIRGQSDEASIGLDQSLQHLRVRVEKLNEKYFSLRKGQEDLNQALKKEDQIRQQIAHLERIKQEVSQWDAELKTMRETRSALRSEIAKINDEIFGMRLEEVEKVNALYSDRVLLTLNQAAQSHAYRNTLLRLLGRSRLRFQEEIASDIAQKVQPHDLVDIVEASDSQRLADAVDRDLGQMVRLVGFLIDNPELYELEAQVFEDELEITLYDEGVAKRVDQLSKGQKATAMLPLILREADYPLIFDQPEDDLDNRFIFDTLVERVRDLKKTRQLIFVTHNANIPVLGDAEQVVVMKMESPRKAGVPQTGKVDDVREGILNLLEGGAEAFKRRQQRYGHLVT